MAVRPQCPPATDERYFFPDGVLIPNNASDDRHQRRAVGEYLAFGGLKSLSCGDGPDEEYRALWLPHGKVSALVVSLSRERARWVAETIVFTPLTFIVEDRAHRVIGADQAQAIVQALEEGGFWTMPVWGEAQGSDTALSLIEGRVDRGYRAVSRANGDRGSFRTAFELLLKAGQPNVRPGPAA